MQRITDNPSGNSLVFQSGTGNNMKVTGYNYNTNTAVPLFLSVDGGNTLINSGGGNVGIGTSSPTARLTIVGDGLNGYSLGVSGNVGIGGNVTQNRDKSGMPKAMIYLNGDGTILRCYNGLMGASTGNCGFTSGRVQTGSSGWYFVNFGIQVSDRFWAATVSNGCCNSQVTVQVEPWDANTLRLIVQIGQTSLTDRPVMLIIY